MSSGPTTTARFVVLAGALLFLLAPDDVEASIRFDVAGSPTEVINTGRSEVLGSVNLVVRGSGNVSGSSQGGASQLGLIFSNPALAIDNDALSGIRLFYSPGFASAVPTIVNIENRDLNGRCAGFLSINFPAGAALADGDFVRIEGIRGRIDSSAAIVPGTDLYVDLQSVNDPAALSFSVDRIRVAKSLKGLSVEVVQEALTFYLVVSEGFERAFVDRDANDDGVNGNDRTDTGGGALGLPANSTQILVTLYGLPSGVADVLWPGVANSISTGARLVLLESSYSNGIATAAFSFEAADQTGRSDKAIDSFIVSPALVRGDGPCNTDLLTASAALGPAVGVGSGCGAPSASARPRFVESYEPVLSSLTPASATVGGEALNVTVYGAGFRPGCVVRWNGSERPTAFINANTLRVSITAADIAKVGSAAIVVVLPAETGGARSSSLQFNITAHPLSLYFPRLATADAPGTPAEYTGIALANVSGEIARLKLTALDSAGTPLAGTGITNPVAFSLPAGEQSPFLAHEVFGEAVSRVESPAWVKVEGNVQQVVGFFLAFDGSLRRLDGTSVLKGGLRDFILPELQPGGFGRINVANPSDDPALLDVELLKEDGEARTDTRRVTIAPKGVWSVTVASMFPGTTVGTSDYLRVTSSQSVVPLESFGSVDTDLAGLNGLDVPSAARLLYAPQYVSGGSWRSTVSLVNPGATPGTVSLRLVKDDGDTISSIRTFAIPAHGRLRLTESDLWRAAEADLLQGYLEISADVKLVGNVVFSASAGGSFSAALPLVSTLSAWAVLSHVASDQSFFTGLAMMNPGDSPARALIQVFDRKGKLVVSKIELVPARGRRSRLLTEYFPELVGVSLQSGYITVSSPIQGLGCFALFGTSSQSVLSAIPAQVLQ